MCKNEKADKKKRWISWSEKQNGFEFPFTYISFVCDNHNFTDVFYKITVTAVLLIFVKNKNSIRIANHTDET